MRFVALLSVLLAMCASAPAAAQAPVTTLSSEQQDLARRFVAMGGAETTFVEGAIRGFMASAERNGAALSALQQQRLHLVLAEGLREPARVYVDELAAYYAANATAHDLQAAIAYYGSESGRRYAGAAVDLSLAVALYAVAGADLPDTPLASSLSAQQLVLARRLAAAFQSRMTPADRERLRDAGFDVEVFADWLSRFFAARLDQSDLEAAAVWAESAESMRLEGPSADRAGAEAAAQLRAIRAFDINALQRSIDRIRRESST